MQRKLLTFCRKGLIGHSGFVPAVYERWENRWMRQVPATVFSPVSGTPAVRSKTEFGRQATAVSLRLLPDSEQPDYAVTDNSVKDKDS
jgi:hypothetical protein